MDKRGKCKCGLREKQTNSDHQSIAEETVVRATSEDAKAGQSEYMQQLIDDERPGS